MSSSWYSHFQLPWLSTVKVVLLSLLLTGWENSPLPYYVVCNGYLKWVILVHNRQKFFSWLSFQKKPPQLFLPGKHHSTTGIFNHKVYLWFCIENKPLQLLIRRILALFCFQSISCLTPDCRKCLVPSNASGWSTHRGCGVSDLLPVPLGKVHLPEKSYPQGMFTMAQPLPHKAQHHQCHWHWRWNCAQTQKCALEQRMFGGCSLPVSLQRKGIFTNSGDEAH